MVTIKEEFSLYNMDNIEKAKVDSNYLGELIKHNSKLIWFSIHKYVNISSNFIDSCGITHDDIYQLGCIGFMKAIKSFDTKRGSTFSSFAAITIAREVMHFMRSNYSVIRLPRSAQDILKQIRKIEVKLGYMPTIKELAGELNMPEKKLERIVKINTSSLEEDNENKSNLIESEDRVDLSVEDRIFIEKLIDTVKEKLSRKEMKILKLRLNGVSKAVVAKLMKTSNVNVARTINKIKSILIEEGFFENMKGEEIYDTGTDECDNDSIDISDSTDTGGAGDFYSEFPENQSRTDQEANE